MASLGDGLIGYNDGYMNMVARASAVIVFAAFFLFPLDVLAQGGLAPTCDDGGCGFTEFIAFVRRIIGFIIAIGVPIAVILFSYAGLLYLTSGAKPDQRTQANKIFVSVFVGFVIMLSAWLMVGFITSLLINDSEINTNPRDVFESPTQ